MDDAAEQDRILQRSRSQRENLFAFRRINVPNPSPKAARVSGDPRDLAVIAGQAATERRNKDDVTDGGCRRGVSTGPTLQKRRKGQVANAFEREAMLHEESLII